MNEDIYGTFTHYCVEKFPHFRLQDLIAHSLLDFIEKYVGKNSRISAKSPTLLWNSRKKYDALRIFLTFPLSLFHWIELRDDSDVG